MKRILALMLIAVLMISSLPLVAPSAHMIDSVRLSVDKFNAYIGDTLT